MSHFEQLHPALQHHIVNSLGWRELRPFQDAVIPSILAGEHAVILAPTAGGKTEAAFLPMLSRMLTENWRGLSVLYICPIRALLNNLDVRLHRYSTLLGRRSALWHGDVKQSPRRRILRDPPDSLLTTPESLEAMLISNTVNAKELLRNIRAVIVDEIHAFAGDDRGWHLLSVLARISKIAGREIQRIGLSATVGNPDVLVDWLAGTCQRPHHIHVPPVGSAAIADVQLDFVGSLQNAAIVLSRLHRGEKRLVFVDSRSKAEKLASELRRLETTTFVTHSSLSQEQRHQAEEAFASRDDCVIVATSVLELGIDVGDLDRVIQIDSPGTVSSFLQRMGRTGRRTGTERNCLFLATKDESLLQAAGLIDLWATGYVEPIEPPSLPYNVLVQQLMALILQEEMITLSDWFDWLRPVPAFAKMPQEKVERIIGWMFEHQYLWQEEGVLGLARSAEQKYGRRHFLELMSVFLSPPLFQVLHGRQDLGYVDETTFFRRNDGPRVLLLGGRSWRVNHIDWQRRIAYVESSEDPGHSRWTGSGQGLGFKLSQSIRDVLVADTLDSRWSSRAQERMAQIRDGYSWAQTDGTFIVVGPMGEVAWWTFAGFKANSSLAPALSQAISMPFVPESLCLSVRGKIDPGDLRRAIETVRLQDQTMLKASIDPGATQQIKFVDCLPDDLARSLLEARLEDAVGVRHALASTPRLVIDRG